MADAQTPSLGHPNPGYTPPTIPGSAYGYTPITQLSPNLARAAIAFPDRVQGQELDISGLDHNTAAVVTEAHFAVKGVMTEAQEYWKGMLDARCGTKDARAPEVKGGILEIQYLRGFIDAHLAADAKKLAPPNTPPAPRAQYGAGEPTPILHAYEQLDEQLEDDTPDDVSVHSAGTEVAHLRPHAPRTVPKHSSSAEAVHVTLDHTPDNTLERESVTMMTADSPSSRAPSPSDGGPAADVYDYDQMVDDIARPRSFTPPDPRITPRPARHMRPRSGQFAFTGLVDVPLPEGRDCMTISEDWDPEQRAALLEYDGEVAWVTSEDTTFPASPEMLAEVLIAMSKPLFQDETPPRPVLPFTRPDGGRPSSIAVIGTKEQIGHLTTTGTWSTSWLCLQVFPNHPRPLRFVCTFEGLCLPYREHRKAKQMVRTCIENSAEVAALFPDGPAKLQRALDTLELQHLAVDNDGEPNDRWNMMMDPPVEGEERTRVWRLTVAKLHPKDPLRGELEAVRHPFKCTTCGCLTHPRRMCPASAAPGWFGFVPRPYKAKRLWGRDKAARRTVKIRGVHGETLSSRAANTNAPRPKKKYKGFAPGFRAPHLYHGRLRAR